MTISTHMDYIKAGSPQTAAEELRGLYKSDIAAVRRRVAENPSVPLDLLAEMSKDCDPQVRIAVGLNKSTEFGIIARLASDEDADVRFWLASASYLSERLLNELKTDANPFVAHRARRTLNLLREKHEPKLTTIFRFLEEDHAVVIGKLEKLITHRAEWSSDKIFAESLDVFDGLRRHFDQQHEYCLELIESAAHTDVLLRKLLHKSEVDQQRILAAVDALLIMRGDEQEFGHGLQQLLELVMKHTQFAETELFTELRKHLPILDITNVRTPTGHELLA